MLYKIFISLILLTSTLFTQNKLTIIVGATYSTGALDEEAESYSINGKMRSTNSTGIFGDFENLIGIKIGFEKEIAGFIGGISYSQRGFKHSWDYRTARLTDTQYSSSDIDLLDEGGKGDFDIKIDYLTGYVLAPISILNNVDILIGAEVGYWVGAQEEEDSSSQRLQNDVDSHEWYEQTGQKFDYGPVFGAKYKFSNNLSIVGTYYFGKGDAVASLGMDNVFFQNRSVQIYLNYAL